MKIASVEDDAAVARQICALLGRHGHVCENFANGGSLIAALHNRHFDLILMDWRLPDMDGIELTRWIRQILGSSVPILFLTNRVLEDDEVVALSAGADDYIVKPLYERSFIARVNALLRRTSPKSGEVIRIGPYELDPRLLTITLHDTLRDVTPREFDLAYYFFSHADRLIPAEVLEKAVWGRLIGADSRTVTTHLSRLRIKLELRPANGVRLSAIYGRGYRLDVIDDIDPLGEIGDYLCF